MNVLIVYAHEEPKSFNAALKDRDLSVELAVVGKVDFAHTARPEGREDFVRTKFRTCFQRHESSRIGTVR